MIVAGPRGMPLERIVRGVPFKVGEAVKVKAQ